jgi:hypothetical protein
MLFHNIIYTLLAPRNKSRRRKKLTEKTKYTSSSQSNSLAATQQQQVEEYQEPHSFFFFSRKKLLSINIFREEQFHLYEKQRKRKIYSETVNLWKICVV